MPLDVFIDEVMELFQRRPTPSEILVETCRFFFEAPNVTAGSTKR